MWIKSTETGRTDGTAKKKESKCRLRPWDDALRIPFEKRKVIKDARQSEINRILIEGKFGNGKRWYGMNYIMTKLQETSATTIAADVLMLNLEKLLRELLSANFYRLMKWIKYFQITPLRLKIK